MLLILAIVSIKILTDHKIITFANKSVKDYQKAQNDETSKLNDVAKIMSSLNNKQTVDLTGKYYENGNTASGIYYEIKDNKITTIKDGQITQRPIIISTIKIIKVVIKIFFLFIKTSVKINLLNHMKDKMFLEQIKGL